MITQRNKIGALFEGKDGYFFPTAQLRLTGDNVSLGHTLSLRFSCASTCGTPEVSSDLFGSENEVRGGSRKYFYPFDNFPYFLEAMI